jgi:RimJ/RimL family protein N-acetyltransferase
MIRLCPVQARHFSQIREWSRSEALAAYWRRSTPEWTWPDDISNYFGASYMICDEDEPIGMAQISAIDTQNRKAEYGLFIDKAKCFERAAAAIAATHQVLSYLFDCVGLEKVYCLVLDKDRHISRLLAMHGFRQDGVLRNNLFWQGMFWDEKVMSLLNYEHTREGEI